MFTVNYSGYNLKNQDNDIIYRPNGSGDYLFLLLLSPMKFTFGKATTLAKPGACILYTPGFPQHYQAEKEFLNSFVHFHCDINFLSDYSFPHNKLFYPSDVQQLNWFLKKIHEEYFVKSPNYNSMCEAYCTQLFVNLNRGVLSNLTDSTRNTVLFESFQQLRLYLLSYCNEEWSIERMCSFVNLEKSQLYTYYNYFFHISPKADLIRARIDKAKYLLTNEAMQISQVATASGFKNIYHFSRYFKQICGCSPSEYGKISLQREDTL